ncbi:unnamed protein product, partial [Adineta ricciae]
MESIQTLSIISRSTSDGHQTVDDEQPNDLKIEHLQRRRSSRFTSLRFLPDSILLAVFSYLTPLDLIRCTRVCHRWYLLVSRHQQLWRRLFLRPESTCGYIGAIHVRHVEPFISVLGTRCGSALLYIDLPVELITVDVLRELAIRCPNLQYLTLDFSSAMQLHDFNDLYEFPCNLKRLCICLSEVIFLEAFMRRIYGYLSSLQTLHIIGTMEKPTISSQDDVSNYETINLGKIKASAPNLRVINLYGIGFIDDSHVEAIASGCIHLQCLALNYCIRVCGTSFKALMARCIQDAGMLAVNWSSTQLKELDLASTELSEKALLTL